MMEEQETSTKPPRYWLVALLEAELREAGNQISAPMGWGDQSFTAPYPPHEMPVGSDAPPPPISHYVVSVEIGEREKKWLDGEEITIPAGVNLDPAVIRAVIDRMVWMAVDMRKRPSPKVMFDELVKRLGVFSNGEQ